MSQTGARLVSGIVFGLVILLPMVWVIWLGVDGASAGEISGIWTRTDVQGLLANSIFLALLTTIFALALGLPLAVLLNLRTFPGRSWIGLLYFLPLVIPPHIHAIAWTRVIGDRGWLTRWLADAASLELDVRAPLGDPATSELWGHIYPGPAWIMGCAFFPLVTLAVSAGVRALDPEAIRAARLAGGARRTLLRVVLPQVAPRILAGASFVFVLALSTYPVVSLLDTPALIQKVFFTFSRVNQEAGALLSLPLVAVAALAVIVLGVAEARAPRRQTGIEDHARVQAGWGTTILAVAPLALAGGVPLVSLIREAGPLSFFGDGMDNYQSVFDRVSVAFQDSLEFSLMGVAALLLLSYPLGRLLARHRAPGLEAVGFSCLAFPPVVVGVALLLFWSRASSGDFPASFLITAVLVLAAYAVGVRGSPARLGGTALLVLASLLLGGYLLHRLKVPAKIYRGGAALLVLAYLARFLPFTVRLFRNGFLALDPDEDAAARLAGHGWLRRTLVVELPRMGGVLVGTAVMAYVLCFTELAATLMVIPEGSQSVQIRIFNMIHYRAVGEVAALCVLVILLAALPVVLLALLGRKKVDVL